MSNLSEMTVDASVKKIDAPTNGIWISKKQLWLLRVAVVFLYLWPVTALNVWDLYKDTTAFNKRAVRKMDASIDDFRFYIWLQDAKTEGIDAMMQRRGLNSIDELNLEVSKSMARRDELFSKYKLVEDAQWWFRGDWVGLIFAGLSLVTLIVFFFLLPIVWNRASTWILEKIGSLK